MYSGSRTTSCRIVSASSASSWAALETVIAPTPLFPTRGRAKTGRHAAASPRSTVAGTRNPWRSQNARKADLSWQVRMVSPDPTITRTPAASNRDRCAAKIGSSSSRVGTSRRISRSRHRSSTAGMKSALSLRGTRTPASASYSAAACGLVSAATTCPPPSRASACWNVRTSATFRDALVRRTFIPDAAGRTPGSRATRRPTPWPGTASGAAPAAAPSRTARASRGRRSRPLRSRRSRRP